MSNKNIFLRLLTKYADGSETWDIFEGDIEKDRDYQKECHMAEARYFKLSEVK